MGDTSPPGGFLPPEAPGPEPDLGPAPAPASAPGQLPPPPPGYGPPAHAQTSPVPGPQAPPPAWGGGAPSGPDNGPAVLGFCLSLGSVGLLVFSAGLSSLLSVGLAIPGMLQSRKGSRLIRDGLTAKNGGLASAGFVIGIVALVLSVLATIFWIAIAILVATDDDARREFEREFDRQYEEQSSVTAVLVFARIVGLALS